MKMTTELNGCQHGKENLFGAIDTPGIGDAYSS
jgi:hypothetical protein